MEIEIVEVPETTTDVIVEIPETTTPYRSCRTKPPPSHSLVVDQKPNSNSFKCVILEVFAVFLLAIGAAFSAAFPRLRQITTLSVPLWKWEVLVLVVLVSRHFSRLVVGSVMLILKVVLKSFLSLAYVVEGVRKDMKHVFTRIIVYSSFYHLFVEEATKSSMYQTVIKGVLALLLWSLVSFLISVIMVSFAAWFHMRTYREWVMECIFNWYVIKAIDDDSWMEVRDFIDPKKTSTRKMKKLILKGKIGLCGDMQSEEKVRSAATKIFEKVAKAESSFFEVEDVMKFLPKDCATKFILLFPGSSITALQLEDWMVRSFKHEKALVVSMKMMDLAAREIRGVVNILRRIVMTLFFLVMIGGLGSYVLTPFTPAGIVGVAFALQNVWKPVSEAMIFIFIVHPYDVGDVIQINDKGKVVVEDIKIISSTFVGVEDKARVICTSVELGKTKITNLSRGLVGEEVFSNV